MRKGGIETPGRQGRHRTGKAEWFGSWYPHETVVESMANSAAPLLYGSDPAPNLRAPHEYVSESQCLDTRSLATVRGRVRVRVRVRVRGRIAWACAWIGTRRVFRSMAQAGKAGQHRAEAIEESQHRLDLVVRSELEDLDCFQGSRRFRCLTTGAPESSNAVTANPTRSLRNPKVRRQKGATKLVRERRVPPWQTFRDLLSQPQSVACHRERVQAMMIEARQARSSRRSRPVVASRHAFRTTTTPASLEHELEHGHGHGHGLDHEHDPTHLNTAAMRSISLLYSWGYLSATRGEVQMCITSLPCPRALCRRSDDSFVGIPQPFPSPPRGGEGKRPRGSAVRFLSEPVSRA